MSKTLVEAAIAAGQPLATLPQRKPKVMLGTPCHSAKVCVDHHVSVLQAVAVLIKHNVDYVLDFNVGASIDYARSTMASAFLKTDCTHLLFIDDDIAFAPDLIVRLLMENVDIVAVPYRRKTRDVKYNLRHDVRVKKMPDRPYMIGVENIATGMMMIRRNVFERLESKVPEIILNSQGEKARLFFRHELVDDEIMGGISYMSEDYYFCKICRENGYEIWAYIDEPLAHIGPYAYECLYSEFAAKGADGPVTNDRPRQPLKVMLK